MPLQPPAGESNALPGYGPPRVVPPDYSLLIPFVLPPTIINRMRMGRGQLFLITAAAGAPLAVKHDLGRTPHLVMILDNGPNLNGDRTIQARTATQVTFTPTQALTNALIWLL